MTEDGGRDIDDSPEEDEELVLDGSELHNYLKTFKYEDVNVYMNRNEAKVPEYPQKPVELKMTPGQNMVLIKMILKSSLLMEDDASYLFKVSSEYVPEKESFMYSKEHVCVLFIIGIISTMVYFYFGFTDSIFLPIIIISAISFFPLTYNQYFCLKNERSLQKLLKSMEDFNLLLRKIIRSVAEDESLITSKEISLKLRGEEDLIEVHKYRKSLPEVMVLISRAISVLKHLIIVSRRKTFSLTKNWKPDDFKTGNYIAFCSDEQLGLNAPNEVFDINMHYLSILDNLKNIYLLMQSECLRILGLCLLQHHYSRLLKIVCTYNNDILSVLCLLEKQYKNYFVPVFPLKEINQSNNSKYADYFLIHDVGAKLRSLFFDIRTLCNFLEVNDNSEEKAKYITSTLSDVEKELTILSETVQSLSRKFLKKMPKTPGLPDVSYEKKIQNPEIKVNSIQVGYSDFSVQGEDEVFLGCSNDYKNNLDTGDFAVQEERLDPPVSLIQELKIALIKKRDEFEQREIKALKNNEELEAYKSCLNSNVMILPHLKKTPEQSYNCNKGLPLSNSDMTFLPFQENHIDSSISGGSVQKNIALAASNLSLGWNAMKTVDYFEDDLNDEEA